MEQIVTEIISSQKFRRYGKEVSCHSVVLAVLALRTLMAAAAAEEILELFDSYWFYCEILTSKIQGYESSPTARPIQLEHHEIEESKFSSIQKLQVSSCSDWCLGSGSSLSLGAPSPSPRSVITTPKLQKILAGIEVSDFSKEVEEHEETQTVNKKKRSYKGRRQKGTSRSLSELEYEELKGFMDLGFVFTEEDRTSNLASIIPGLQRRAKKVGEQVDDEYAVSRPYLSETWGVLDQRKVNKSLMHLRFPALQNEISIKDHLKAWAHTVASTVI